MSNTEILGTVNVPVQVMEQSTAITPPEMLARALSQGANIDVLERLMNLQERWEQAQARKAFDAAMAAAKADIPVILKNKAVDFTSSKGRTNYRHEDLAQIARTIDPILSKNGLSYRFSTSIEGGSVFVTCIVSHRDGHSEQNTLSASRDETGNKNNIQAMGSTITYLQRYTLKAALGLSASADDDGKSSEPAGVITGEQAAAIRALALEVRADMNAFTEYFGIGGVDDLPAKDFDRAMRALEKKRARP